MQSGVTSYATDKAGNLFVAANGALTRGSAATVTPTTGWTTVVTANLTSFQIDPAGNLLVLVENALSRGNADMMTPWTTGQWVTTTGQLSDRKFVPGSSVGWTQVATSVSSFSLDDAGYVTVLTTDGTLEQAAAGTATPSSGWTTLVTGVGVSQQTDAAGSQFLLGNGILIRGAVNPATGNTNWQTLATGVTGYTLDRGNLFFVSPAGVLQRGNADTVTANTLTQLATGVSNYTIDQDGTLIVLQNSILERGNGATVTAGTWAQLGTGVSEYVFQRSNVLGASGTLYALLNGTLGRGTAATVTPNTWAPLATGVTKFVLDQSGDLVILQNGVLRRAPAQTATGATAWTQIYSSLPPWAVPGYPYPTVSDFWLDDSGKLTILDSAGDLLQGAANTVYAAPSSGGGWSFLVFGTGQHALPDAAGDQFLAGWNGALARGLKNPQTGATNWQVLFASGVTGYAVDKAGNLFVATGGTLKRGNAETVTATSGWTTVITAGLGDFKIDAAGTLFTLDNGTLYRGNADTVTAATAAGWVTMAASVSRFSFDDAGRLTVLTTDGTLKQAAAPDTATATVGWVTLAAAIPNADTDDFDAAGNQYLLGSGTLIRGLVNAPAGTVNWQTLATGVSSFVLDGANLLISQNSSILTGPAATVTATAGWTYPAVTRDAAGNSFVLSNGDLYRVSITTGFTFLNRGVSVFGIDGSGNLLALANGQAYRTSADTATAATNWTALTTTKDAAGDLFFVSNGTLYRYNAPISSAGALWDLTHSLIYVGPTTGVPNVGPFTGLATSVAAFYFDGAGNLLLQTTSGSLYRGPASTVTSTTFTALGSGALYPPNAFGTVFTVTGPTWTDWQSLGGANGVLGNAIGNVTALADGVGKYQSFQNGTIYWSAASGAHAVLFGALFSQWVAQGGTSGPLGYPTRDPAGLADGAYRVAAFQGGALVDLGSTVVRVTVPSGATLQSLAKPAVHPLNVTPNLGGGTAPAPMTPAPSDSDTTDAFVQAIAGDIPGLYDQLKKDPVNALPGAISLVFKDVATAVVGPAIGVATTALLAPFIGPAAPLVGAAAGGALAPVAGAYASSIGTFVGSELETLVNIIRGQDSETVGQIVGELGAIVVTALPGVAAVATPLIPLAATIFGDGAKAWDFIRTLGADLGGDLETGIEDIGKAIVSLGGDLGSVAKDAWNAGESLVGDVLDIF